MTVRNAHVDLVKGKMRLEVDRWGQIDTGSEPFDRVCLTNNVSKDSYELTLMNAHDGEGNKGFI